MTDELLALLVVQTYRRSDLSYRVSLIREFAEFAIFTRRATTLDATVLDDFAATKNKSAAEIGVLRRVLPALGKLSQGALYDRLKELEDALNALATLVVTVPVVFAEKDIEAIGEWVRSEISNKILLDVVVDPQVIAGCVIAWRSRAYDYSFEHYLNEQQKPVQAQILARISAPLTAV